MAKDAALSVLVVDNNPVDRALICSFFERLGLFPDSAAHGREALQACGAKAYGLILMDCDLPVLDGRAAAREIRSGGGKSARARIVGMAAGKSRDADGRGIPEAMDGLLVKPFDIHELREQIAAAMDGPPEGSAV